MGIGISYAVFASTNVPIQMTSEEHIRAMVYDPEIHELLMEMMMQDEEHAKQMLTNEEHIRAMVYDPEVHEAMIKMMMQDEEHSKQMFQDSISTPMQKHHFTETLMETLDSDPELRMHVMAHLMSNEDFMKEMPMPSTGSETMEEEKMGEEKMGEGMMHP